MNLDKNDEERKNSQIKKEHLHSFQLTFEHVSYRNWIDKQKIPIWTSVHSRKKLHKMGYFMRTITIQNNRQSQIIVQKEVHSVCNQYYRSSAK